MSADERVEPASRGERLLRFVLALVSFVLAFGMIGYGIAQRTVLAGPDELTESISVPDGPAVMLLPGSVLTSFPGHQRVEISGPDGVFAAYGRTADVKAWIGDTRYTAIGYDAESDELTSTLVRGQAATVPDPAGSDLWLQEYSAESTLDFVTTVPDDVSVLVVSNGTSPAPSHLSISWPVDNRTPWSGPLIYGGALLLILGLVFYVWALVHLRRVRGPRRKPPKMPKVPRRRLYKPNPPKALPPARGRRSARRLTAVLPAMLVPALVLTGCSAQDWPFFDQAASSPSPSSSIAVKAAESRQAPAVTPSQAGMIVERVAQVAKEADAALDTELLGTRFEGPAFELREANYAIRAKDKEYEALPAIPSSQVELILPQQSDSWPRTVLAVIQNTVDTTKAPVALVMVQHTPRDNYKVQYAITLEANATLPEVAPANVGTSRLPPDTKLLLLPPAEIAGRYGDTLIKGGESEFIGDFVTEGDTLREQVGPEAKKEKKDSLPATAAMTFSNEAGSGASIALATIKSGALVAVSLNEVESVKPVEDGASVNPEGAVKTLSGVTSTTKGVSATYGDQLLFYVPPTASTQKIKLLGYSQGLIAAKELK